MNMLFQVCVEGNIGSGKTTLIDYFSNIPDVEVGTGLTINHSYRSIGQKTMQRLVGLYNYCVMVHNSK